jgi:BED zinc finger
MESENTATKSTFDIFSRPRSTVEFTNSENSNVETGSTSGSMSSSKNSTVWVHFTRDNDFATSKKASCNYCHKKYVCNKGSTTNLHTHLRKFHSPQVRLADSGESINVESIFTNTKVNIYLYY